MGKAAWSERRLHAWMARQLQPRGLRAPFGDDAASLVRGLRRPVLCADQCVEGVHFAADVAASRAGSKAVARALSDLAANAAQPRAVLLCAALPATVDDAWVRALLRGARRCARTHGAELVGGDLSATRGPVVLSVCAVGEQWSRGVPPARSGVRAGDWLLASGNFGGSGLGRHLRIRPRIDAGRALYARGARALTDVSDGLARDLARMARLSGVAIRLNRVPIHPDARRAARISGRSALDHALHDGEDHELIAAMAPRDAQRLLRRPPRTLNGLCAIGVAVAGRGLWVPVAEGSSKLRRHDPTREWTHGAS